MEELTMAEAAFAVNIPRLGLSVLKNPYDLDRARAFAIPAI
jgi:hypothetical protein